MSYTELHTGKAHEVSTDFKGLQSKLVASGVDVSELDKDELEEGYIDADSGYVYLKSKDKLFKLQDHKSCEPEDFLLQGNKTNDTIDFALMFYNGGTCFEEMFEDLVDKLEKEKDDAN